MHPLPQETILYRKDILKKKADVAEYPKAFDHVGLLNIEPPGRTGLLFI